MQYYLIKELSFSSQDLFSKSAIYSIITPFSKTGYCLIRLEIDIIVAKKRMPFKLS